MTTPTTPEACRAEQERVLKLLSNADTPESWYYQPGWGLQKHNADGLGLIAGQSDFAKHGDLLLLEAAPTLARQYAALLAAHGEALEREAALLAGLAVLKKKWDAEYDSHGIEHAYEESGGVLIGKGQAADELGDLLAALAPASAGGEG